MFNDELVAKKLLDTVSEGLIFIDQEGLIKIYNRKAKKIFGIIYNQGKGHKKGKLEKGDIVIIADTNCGIDDGDLVPKDLEKIGIQSNQLELDESFICIGKYLAEGLVFEKNNSLNQMAVNKKINNKMINASIDHAKKIISVKIDTMEFTMSYIKTLGFIVILDKNLNVKFYQAKGYTTRNESIKDLLCGNIFMAKGNKIKQINVIDRHIYDIHTQNKDIESFYLAATGKDIQYENKYVEINGRPTLCTLEGINKGGHRIGAVLKVRDISELKRLIKERDNALKRLNVIENRLINKINMKDYFPNIIGTNKEMLEIKKLAYKISKSDSNVLIMGDSGTGKSLIAESIHKVSRRKKENFVHINCGSIPENLIESELFGYVEGAFTGAKSSGKIGYFQKANKGTLFLDEIGELPLKVQPKLLKVLQNQKFYKVGGVEEITVDLKIICATNKNLEKQVKKRNFREDLYYRIDVLQIYLPALKERKEDIIKLTNYLLPSICEKIGFKNKRLSIGAIQKLKSYDWPGNIRELENILERAVNLTEREIIFSDDLNIESQKSDEKEYLKTLEEVKNSAEKNEIIKVIERYKGNRKKILNTLSIGKSAFYNKLKKHEINIP